MTRMTVGAGLLDCSSMGLSNDLELSEWVSRIK